MPTEQILSGEYFDTPARAERLQLLLHLVRNAGEVIYLRGPAGAGKTRFIHRLFDIFGDETATVWVAADGDCDVPAVAIDQLGLEPGDVSPWPDAVFNRIGDRDLLVVVDDADRLSLEAVESLANLHARGGRLLLVGQGGLAQTSGNWDVQFVDLPPFDAEQTVAFLRTQAGDQAARVTDDLAAGLHRAANGVPGLLLDALNGVLASRRSTPRVPQPAVGTPDMRRRPVWHWVAIALALVVLVAVLQFQDQINAVFLPEDALELEAVDTVVVEPVSPAGQIEHAPAPAPAEDPRKEAVAALMPEISLPELSREPTASGSTMAGDAETPPQPTADTSTEPAVADSVDDEDPLDAVMRDALAASEQQKTAEPAEAEPQAEMPKGSPDVAGKGDAQAVVTDKSADEAAAVTQEIAKQTPKPVPEETATPAPVVEPKPAAVVSRAAPVSGSDWLRARPPTRYTLQLVGARDRAAVRKFVRDFGISEPYAIFERDLKGKPWYSLVAGDYPNRDAAIGARARLPKRLERSGVWPRTFESIQKDLK